MQGRLGRRLLIFAGLGLVTLAIAWSYRPTQPSAGSITVKLPPANSTPRPRFKF